MLPTLGEEIMSLLQLTEAEQRIIQEHMGANVPRIVHLLNAAYDWAVKNGTPEDFQNQFPRFIADYRLTPALAKLAEDYVLSWTCSDEEMEREQLEMRGLAVLLSKEPEEHQTEADKAAVAAFLEGAKNEYETASASQREMCLNVVARDLPTTKGEIDEGMVLAYLREWVHRQIQ
jgi:hypothetical protein